MTIMNALARHLPLVGNPQTRTRRLHAWVRDTCAEHPWAGAIAVAFTFLAVAVATALHYDLPMRDPVGYYRLLVLPLTLIAGFLLVDVVGRTIMLHRRGRVPLSDALRRVATERATPGRVIPVFAGFLAFQITYIAYRNLKSFLTHVRSNNQPADITYDQQLMDFDRWLFFGHAPATLLHDLLGTGVTAHVLAAVYVFFLMFVPISVAFALTSGHIRDGMWFITALMWNWILGTASYYLIPALGPFAHASGLFEDLPSTSASELQEWLNVARGQWIHDPVGFGNQIQGVAAFASLHVSIVFTAFLATRILGMKRLSYALFVFLVLTTLATIYFGWHYVTDDIAGIAIGFMAIGLAGWTTGKRGRGVTPKDTDDDDDSADAGGDDDGNDDGASVRAPAEPRIVRDRPVTASPVS